MISEQEGVITRAQARAAGVTEGGIRRHLDTGRWQVIYPGVYATFSSPLPRMARIWAAVLWAGRDAVLSHETAAELYGIVKQPAAEVHVTIPATRTLTPRDGVVVHRRARVQAHPALQPPRTRIDDTIVDLTQTARTVEDAYGWLARGVSSRLTTADRLLRTIADRPRLRMRALLREGLGAVAEGCRSVLDLQ